MNILRKYRTHLRLIILLIAASVLFIFRGTSENINRTVERLYHSIGGTVKPDTNIIIIHISQDDIQSLNGWPLKRSYYALLISELNRLKCGKIGIEVFLSPKVTSQNIYNDVLVDEISRSDNVVLSSVFESYDPASRSAELLLPSPKLKLPKLKTGHINYYEKDGIFIPLKFESALGDEPAFSAVLTDPKQEIPPVMKVNFYSSWKSIRNYSLMEIFDLFEADSPQLKSFEGKTVLIGVSSPQVASTAPTLFDADIPGVSIHAFAADNILHNRYIRNNYIRLSAFVFIILLTFFILAGLKSKPLLRYALMFLSLSVISFVLFRFFYIELQYSLFIVSLVVLFIFDGLLYFYERNISLKSEADVLRAALDKKVTQLGRLEKELNVSGANSDQMILERISSLKQDIEKLKLQQTDESPADIEAPGIEMKNFMGIVYRSGIMAQAVDLIRRAAPADATVLITGESGTGKELAARAIHELSNRRGNPFIAVNCAALSETLLESELFGHVKGAFTNAIADKVGRFEAAGKGTIFLDEIGETSENFQVKLLRILQSGEYEKVGSPHTKKADVRIVAATNKKPETLIREKKFREDLFYRLNIIRIEMPPLRERKEDIEVLVKYFLSEEKENMQISGAALNQLMSSSWKGNVRELESVIKRAAIFARSSGRDIIRISDLPEGLSEIDKFGVDSVIIDSLREKGFSHSSVNETAEELGLSRTLVSENLRGIVFRYFVETSFDKDKTVENISTGSDTKAAEKVRSKVNTFLNNIEKDSRQADSRDFDEVRRKLNSKYKNLPQKYHRYLDEVIRYYISK